MARFVVAAIWMNAYLDNLFHMDSSTASSFDPSPSFCSNSPQFSTPGRLEYYDVAGGLMKFILKEKGPQIKASLPSGSVQFERQSHVQRRQNCLSYGFTRFLFMNCLQKPH